MYSNEGSMSTWGIFLFLLILFGLFGGNRCGGGLFGGWNNGGCGYGVVPGALAYGEGQTDRDVLKLETAMVSANALSTAQLETGIRQIINNQDKNTAAILEGQKDLYIRDLERVATQQFITSQNEQTRNLIAMATANQEAKAAADTAALNARLDGIECKMLKTPQFMPVGGLPLIGCGNYGYNFSGSCCPTTV